MKKTLLDFADDNYKLAKMGLQMGADDEGQIRLAAYHLQQAVELTMKYELEQNAVEYPRTHKIDQIILEAEENDIDLHLTEYIEDHAEMFSEWEANTRYILDYKLSYNKVQRAFDEVGKFLESVKLADIQEDIESQEQAFSSIHLSKVEDRIALAKQTVEEQEKKETSTTHKANQKELEH